MKKLITPIIAIAFLFTACTETTDTVIETEKDATETEKVVEEEVKENETEELAAEGTAVEGDDRLKDLSTETTMSECYIVDEFTDMDIRYITVDFIDIKEYENESGYEIVNDNKKLRTFIVKDSYLNFGHEESSTIEQLMNKSKDKENRFMIETENGLVTELYVNLAG
jgi:hypothetical protein